MFCSLCSLKSRGKKGTARCCLQQSRRGFLALYFFSFYIRICNMGRIRDGDIPVGHLCQSMEEMAMAQKFRQSKIRRIHPNCNLVRGLPCITKSFRVTGVISSWWFHFTLVNKDRLVLSFNDFASIP